MKTIETMNILTRNIEICICLGWVVGIEYISQGRIISEWLFNNKGKLIKYNENPKIYKLKKYAQRLCDKIQPNREEKVYIREYFHWSYRKATMDELIAYDESIKNEKNI